MAGDWLKMRLDLHDDPAVISIAAATGLDEDAVVGKLLRLWGWASRQTIDGNAVSVTEKWIDRYLGVDGFARAMGVAGWLATTASGIQIPKWDVHNSQSAKARALACVRAAKCKRKAPPESNGAGATRALPERDPEKRREESKTAASQPAASAANGGQPGLFTGQGQATANPRKNPKAEAFELPPELAAALGEAWGRWLAYLGEKNKRVPSIAADHRDLFVAMGAERAAAAIAHSVRHGYNAPYEPDDKAGPLKDESIKDRISRIRAERTAQNGNAARTNGVHP